MTAIKTVKHSEARQCEECSKMRAGDGQLQVNPPGRKTRFPEKWPWPCTKAHGLVRAIFCLSKAMLSVTYDHRIRSPLIHPLPVAELERSLIVERVKAGLRNTRAKGKWFGRPSKAVDAATVARLWGQGLIWRAIAEQVGVGVGTHYRLAAGRSKIR